MRILVQVLAELAVRHIKSILSDTRDCRLIFPGLTENFAKELQNVIRKHLVNEGGKFATEIKVYLALDESESLLEPNERQGWLHYEAVTSIRQGSFVTICMPKVLPKLHDSIRGSGSPIRGLMFTDEWPWKDDGVEEFRFAGPVLDAILEKWTDNQNSRKWIRELILEGFLRATAPLQDEVRISLFLETFLDLFEPTLYPEVEDVVDKFSFHCGIPKVNEENGPHEYIKDVEEVAKRLEDQRIKNANFRDYLVNDVVENTFLNLDSHSRDRIKRSLDAMLDGVLKFGSGSGFLAFNGGLGNESSSQTVEAWSTLDIECLKKIFRMDGRDEIQCEIALRNQNGLVSANKKRCVIFEGDGINLNVNVKIGEHRFAPDVYNIRCKRRQHEIYQQICDEDDFDVVIPISSSNLPCLRGCHSILIQLVYLQQVAAETRIYVHVCGSERPALSVFEPNFYIVDLLEYEPDSSDSNPEKLNFQEPVHVHLFDSLCTSGCRVTVDDDEVKVEVMSSSSHEYSSSTRYALREPIDLEAFFEARANLRLETSNLIRDVTLCGDDIKPGGFTLEDELRIATAKGDSSRLERVLRLFRGESDLTLPKLGDIDAASRRRIILAREIEKSDGWKPILVDFLNLTVYENFNVDSKNYWKSTESRKSFLDKLEPQVEFSKLLEQYVNCRTAIFEFSKNYVKQYTNPPSERPCYIVSPNYIARYCESDIEESISQYLNAYQDILNFLKNNISSKSETFILVHLDSVVLSGIGESDGGPELGISLLGPWHPLVVAKRFMVQQNIYATSVSKSNQTKVFKHLVALFDQVDGFRLIPGFDFDGLVLDVAFAFPTSDPGWHLAFSQIAFSDIKSSRFASLHGFFEKLRKSLGFSSSFFLGDIESRSEKFFYSYLRSHPSRRQLGIRLNKNIDSRPAIESSIKLLGDRSPQMGDIGALLTGGIHLFLEDRMLQRQQLPWQQPGVYVYEDLDDARCYDIFQPDILLLPQREEIRPQGIKIDPKDDFPVPRGRNQGAVFYMPVTDIERDRNTLPRSVVRESGASTFDRIQEDSEELEFEEVISVGQIYRNTLASIDELIMQVRPQRFSVLVQDLGLPLTLKCSWTVLPGACVDVGALATYITSEELGEHEERALWNYCFDVVRSVRAYFIVCKVPKSIVASLAVRSLELTSKDIKPILEELTKIGFAIGETFRSGKAAVGVLGVVGALRLAEAAWKVGESEEQRWCTVILPVDNIEELMSKSTISNSSNQRADLLAINISWKSGTQTVFISPCAIECKYVSKTFSESMVKSAFEQAGATYKTIRQLLELAQIEAGMHARLAVCHILRFGLRLLAARGELKKSDEKIIFEAILSGLFDIAEPISPTLLVTTSCELSGDGVIETVEDGWWVRLTKDSWPRKAPPQSNELVQQLSKLFTSIKSCPDLYENGTRRESPTDVTPTKSVHPVFHGFIGNSAAIQTLSLQLHYMKETRSKQTRSIGLFGPKSTGKTELSRRLARALEIPYLPMNEMSLRDIDQLAKRMQDLAREAGCPMSMTDRQGGFAVLTSPPMLVFIDEVHQLSKRVQDMLLPVLEADDRMLRGSRQIIDVRNVSFVIATTDWGKLREAFRSRVRPVMLEPYNVSEVAQILCSHIEIAFRNKSEVSEIDPAVKDLDYDTLVAIATAARAVPRVALDLLREIGMAIRINICKPDVESVWKYIQDSVPCDRNGLTNNDRKYLYIVATQGPIGLDNISTELGLDRSNVEGAIEPFLSQMRWVKRGSSGRTLTKSGRQLYTQLQLNNLE